MSELPKTPIAQLKERLHRAVMELFRRLPYLRMIRNDRDFVITKHNDRHLQHVRRVWERRQQRHRAKGGEDNRATLERSRAVLEENPPEMIMPPPRVISELSQVLIPAELIESASSDELLFFVAHELIHICFKHLERQQRREPCIWQVASDLEANSILRRAGFSLAEGALYKPEFDRLSAEAIYQQLIQDKSFAKGLISRRRQTQEATLAEPLHNWDLMSSSELDFHYEELARLELKECLHPTEPQDQPWSRSDQEMSARGARSKEQRSRSKSHSQERSYGTQQLEDQLASSALNADGTKRPWAHVLRQFSAHRVRRYHSKRYRRREIPQGLYLPSMRGDGLRLTIALDTSGSTLSLLPCFLQEVSQILEACPYFDLTLIQCSREISAVDEFTHRSLISLSSLELKGGGGTAFGPVFDYVNTRSVRSPNLLIYLTDGRGPRVDQAPNYPVIWVLSAHGTAPADFGVSLELNEGLRAS